MIKNLKLSTITWLFVGLMFLTTVAIVSGAFMIDRNLSVINNTWNELQTEQSEKARLESALQSSIGYGGMIHNFKNYLLRQQDHYKRHTQSNISAAQAILSQYRSLQLSDSEDIAIEKIIYTLNEYLNALHIIDNAIKQHGTSISVLDKSILINDKAALDSLKALRYQTPAKNASSKVPSKAQIVTDLRTAIGYGGLIHFLKNYVIHQDKTNLEKIRQVFQQLTTSIKDYRKLSPNSAERNALSDIEVTLLDYANSINTIQGLASENISPQDIDSSVRVNEMPALRGLQTLEREINIQFFNDSRRVTSAFQQVEQTIKLGTWAAIFVFIFIILITVWLFHTQIIHPVALLTKNMTQLASNNLDVEISGHRQLNEVGKMARAIMVFKTNMIKRQEAEERLANSNREINQQLQENRLLRIQAEKATTQAEAEHELTSSILNTVRDAIITIDTRGIIKVFNPGAEHIFGYTEDEVIGKNISMLMPEPNRSAHDAYLEDFLEGRSNRNQKIPLEQVALRKNNETFPAEVTLNTMHVNGETQFTGLIRDVTERKKWEEEIKKMAMTDPLTALANRNRYTQKLDEMEKQSLRFKSSFAILQIDLDKFKPVNDTYGHPAGDAVLQQVANSLTDSCREVDTVARLGGDEFSIILNGVNESEGAIITAKRIIEKLSHPMKIEGHDIQIGASIGISYYPDDSKDIEELQRMADEALYLAKQDGRNTYKLYNEID